MIDTHAHLSSRFKQEVDLEKLDRVILSASSLQDSKENLELARNNKKLRAAIGIHPQEINDSVEDLEKLMSDEVVAIGECGLEFVEGIDKTKQIELFEKQIELSLKYNKPLIVHSREASDEIVEILSKYKNLRGVIHCYTGGKKRIKKILELDTPPSPGGSGEPQWYFGIDGNLTYEVGLEQVVREIPKNRLILETDTPFLAPIPHRGETNRPEWIEFTYKKLAEIWSMSFEETEKIIDDNAKRLFHL